MDNIQATSATALTVVGYDDTRIDRGLSDRRLVRKVVDLETLEMEIKSFLSAMERILGNISQQVGQYQMDSVTVSAEVNATGKVSLLGSGGEIGGTGGLSFTFKRSTNEDT